MFKIGYNKKITMVQGDTGVIRMRISNYELSQGDEVRFAIVNKANPSILLCQHSDKKIVLEKQVTVFEKDGSARIVIYPYDTEYLQPGKYLYEIQVVTKDGRTDTVVPLTALTLMDGSIQGEFGQTTPSKPEPTPSEIELRFKRLENEIIPELGNRITNVENDIDSVSLSLDKIETNDVKEKKDLSQLFQKDGFVSVITGDSISYNRYDFISTGVANGYECYSGMQSWSYLLRDTIHRNDVYFKHGDELQGLTVTGGFITQSEELYNNAQPFTNKYIKYATTKNTSRLSFKVRHTNSITNKIVIYFSYNPNNTACQFDVYIGSDKACTVNNKSISNDYMGRGILTADVICYPYNIREISLRNFTQSATSPESTGLMEVEILGVGTKYSPVYLTGQGSTTSKWLLDNIEDRILKYNPDFVAITTGTNDVYMNVSLDEYKSNLDNICTKIKIKNPKAEILLIGCGSYRSVDGQDWDNANYKQDSTVIPYINVSKEISAKHECYFVSMMELFENVSINEYRFDNCHLTKYGNTMLLRSIVNMIMPKGSYNNEYLSSYKHENGFEHTLDINETTGYARIKYNDSSKTYDVINGLDIVNDVVLNSNGYRISVNFKNTILKRPPVIQNCSIANLINITHYGFTTSSVEFLVHKADGTLLTPSDHNANECEFLLML